MISWKLAKKLFDGFMILRWTDFIKPVQFVQMEKCAIQGVLTYIIGKEYESRMEKAGKSVELDWALMVDINVCGLLCKLATSDIKSTINNKIKKSHLRELKEYISEVYYNSKGEGKYYNESIISREKLETYILENEKNSEKIEHKICYFSHKYATYREFLLIKDLNNNVPDTDKVENELMSSMTKLFGDAEEEKILKDICHNIQFRVNELNIFISYFEKLRPQVRWSQTCRTPQTTVLGHSMYVATLTYFAIKEMDIQNDADKYLVDNFYCALFHDLPESLTRDIISPVKRSIKNLEKELSNYEFDEVYERIISKITNKWKEHFMYLLGAENNKFNSFSVRKFILGDLVKLMDYLAAFVEAKMSVDLGINSEELQKGIKFTTSKILSVSQGTNSYRCPKKIKCKKELYFNDFLASIPQYDIGSEL